MKVKNGDNANEGETLEITVYDYFSKHCAIELEYSAYLPCVDVGKPKRPNYVPLEVCKYIYIYIYISVCVCGSILLVLALL